MPGLAPEKILKQLADLWTSEGKQVQEESGAGVLRACTMTLVVLSEESDDAAALGETLAALMPEHPARAIVIRLSGAGERALSERVYQQCWMPFGQRRQICCEQIEITASDAALADLPSVLLPLIVADLPLILWCRSARLIAAPDFRPLAAMAQKVVVDTAGEDAATVLPQLAEMVAAGRVLGDLSWTRLTRWREMLAQVFENRENLAALDKVDRVTVIFPGEKSTASALYMGAWVVDSLATAGVRAQLSLEHGEWRGPGEAPQIIRVTVGPVTIERQDGRLSTQVNGLEHCTNLPAVTDYMLVREELGIVTRDPVFERTLVSAARYSNH